MRGNAVALGLLFVAVQLGSRDEEPDFRKAGPDWRIELPRDHRSRPEFGIEWWYFTGRLQSAGARPRRFGYQFTLFRVGVQRPPSPAAGASAFAANDLVMGHLALSDLDRREHVFSEVLWRGAPHFAAFPAPPDLRLASCLAPPGTGDAWELALLEGVENGFAFCARDDTKGIALDLELRPERPVVLHGAEGVSRKAAQGDAASMYYSFTRLATRGMLASGGETLEVQGSSWMDREFATNQLAADQVGWDWFSLQFDDGRDLMLYVLRDAQGGVSFASGTLVEDDGTARQLAGGAFRVTPRVHWESPASGASYPVSFRVEVPPAGIDVEVRAVFPQQENVSARIERLFYWEGAVDVLAGGRRVGVGYVELTGYGEDARLPL